jgi:hypothetical protein
MSSQNILRNSDLQESAVDKAPDLSKAIRRLIAETKRFDFTTDTRVQRSIAYLWAAAEELEGLPGSSTDGLH